MNTTMAEGTFDNAPRRMQERAERMLTEHRRGGLIDVDEEGEKAWKGIFIEACMSQESGKELSREASKGALRKLSQFKEGEMKWRDWKEEVPYSGVNESERSDRVGESIDGRTHQEESDAGGRGL